MSFKFKQHQMTKFRGAAAGFLTAVILCTNSPAARSQDRRLTIAVGAYMVGPDLFKSERQLGIGLSR